MGKGMAEEILMAVSDGSQRVWSQEEIDYITNNTALQEQLSEWLGISLSDCCWHSENYGLIQRLINPPKLEPFSLFGEEKDEETDIPF